MISAATTDARSRHPRMREAVLADARCTAAFRGERHEFRSAFDAILQVLRLSVVSDAFLSQALYRTKASLQRRGVPILPRLFHRLAIASAGVYIGDDVLVHPGVYIVHGQVVIDGVAEIHPRVAISPAVTVAPGESDRGPTIGPGASLGSGSRVLGEVTIGAGAQIGANAVVLSDVPEGGTAIGIPARISGDSTSG